jgi:hypothetical protein
MRALLRGYLADKIGSPGAAVRVGPGKLRVGAWVGRPVVGAGVGNGEAVGRFVGCRVAVVDGVGPCPGGAARSR